MRKPSQHEHNYSHIKTCYTWLSHRMASTYIVIVIFGSIHAIGNTLSIIHSQCDISRIKTQTMHIELKLNPMRNNVDDIVSPASLYYNNSNRCR